MSGTPIGKTAMSPAGILDRLYTGHTAKIMSEFPAGCGDRLSSNRTPEIFAPASRSVKGALMAERSRKAMALWRAAAGWRPSSSSPVAAATRSRARRIGIGTALLPILSAGKQGLAWLCRGGGWRVQSRTGVTNDQSRVDPLTQQPR
jgi:hypothetical protein